MFLDQFNYSGYEEITVEELGGILDSVAREYSLKPLSDYDKEKMHLILVAKARENGQRSERYGFTNFFHALIQIIHDQAQSVQDSLDDPVVGWLIENATK